VLGGGTLIIPGCILHNSPPPSPSHHDGCIRPAITSPITIRVETYHQLRRRKRRRRRRRRKRRRRKRSRRRGL